MCEYTDHGHCGILHDQSIDNDKTLEYLGEIALSHAKAGADMVAPSDMMDGRIGYIRKALDENGFKMLPIMSYAAKYAQHFMDHLEKQQVQHHNLEIERDIKWIQQIQEKQCWK